MYRAIRLHAQPDFLRMAVNRREKRRKRPPRNMPAERPPLTR